MSNITLEALGFTKQELEEKLINQLCAQFLETTCADEDGEEVRVRSSFQRKLEAKITDMIDASITQLADKHILPNVSAYIEALCLQKTNQWGEKVGTKLTFIEYLVQQADAYMREPVNYEGKPKGTDSYSWTQRNTRIGHMVNEHLHYSVERAMKEAFTKANGSVAKGLEEALLTALHSFTNNIKVTTEAKAP